MQIRDQNHVRHIEKHVYNYDSSISFDYIIVKVEIFDLILSFCVDSSETINLLNKFVLFKNDLYNIIHNVFFIIIIDVIEHQIFNQIINIDVELNFKKISFKMIAYLVKNLFSELIIANYVFNLFYVNFQHDNKIIKIDDVEMFLSYNNVDFTSYHYNITKMRFDQSNKKNNVKR